MNINCINLTVHKEKDSIHLGTDSDGVKNNTDGSGYMSMDSADFIQVSTDDMPALECEDVDIKHCSIIENDVLSQKHFSQSDSSVQKIIPQEKQNGYNPFAVDMDLETEDLLSEDYAKKKSKERIHSLRYDNDLEEKEEQVYPLVDLSKFEDDNVPKCETDWKQIDKKRFDHVFDVKHQGDLSDGRGVNHVRIVQASILMGSEESCVKIRFFFIHCNLILFVYKFVCNGSMTESKYWAVRLLYEEKRRCDRKCYDSAHYAGFMRLTTDFYDDIEDCFLPFSLECLKIASGKSFTGLNKYDALPMETDMTDAEMPTTKIKQKIKIYIMLNRDYGYTSHRSPYRLSFKPLSLKCPLMMTWDVVGQEFKKYAMFCWLRGTPYSLYARMRTLADKMISYNGKYQLLSKLHGEKEDVKAWFQEVLMKNCSTELNEKNNDKFDSFVHILKPIIVTVIDSKKSEWYEYNTLFRHMHGHWKLPTNKLNALLEWEVIEKQ